MGRPLRIDGAYAVGCGPCSPRAALSRTLAARLTAIAGLSVLFGAGAWIESRPLVADSMAMVRVVQPNAPQALKWDPRYIPIFFDRALDMSDPEGADLVIWPETAVAPVLDGAGEELRAPQRAGRPRPCHHRHTPRVGLSRI